MSHNEKIRKQAPYVFYGETQSLCETCLKLVPAKILFQEGNVYYQKRCTQHGVQKTLVSTDVEYYLSCKTFIKPGDRPRTVQSKTQYGCPYDCGLCADHEQHSCLALIEINEHCNLQCPVCFAESSPKQTKQLGLETIECMMDALVESEGEPDVLQISGGEPTLHPDILSILQAAKRRPIRHLMLNTNGLRIANDEAFAESLAEFTPAFEVYLQWDSMDAGALKTLRGADLRAVRQNALDNLERFNIATNLVVTVKKGVNDQELGSIIEHALQYRCVRGVTFQPIQQAGRNEQFDPKQDRIVLSEIRSAILQQSERFTADDIIPLPCNPESISVAYALRDGSKTTPVTSLFPKDLLLSSAPNAVTFERSPEIKAAFESLFSLSSGEENCATRLTSLLCCLPQVPQFERLSYENVFRISIVQFLDAYNFCIANVKRSCIHFVTEQGKIIPFDTFNLFYRNGIVEQFRDKIRIVE